MPSAELRLFVQTYLGHHQPISKADYGEPSVPILVHEDRGVRILLGSHDPDGLMPDIQIERRPHGWCIFLNPQGGGDPCALVYFHDDGRSWLYKEKAGSAPELQEVDGIPAEIDAA